MRFQGFQDARLILVAVLLLGLVLTACGTDSLSNTPTPEAVDSGQPAGSSSLVLGNIDAKNPADKFAEFQPLVDYLVANLGEFGIEDGEVVIAKDTAEMARLVSDGEVDIYIDAAIPSLEVCSTVECDFALRQWKGGVPEMGGVFVTSKNSGISTLDDLRGKIIMLEQLHSTVGHILPLAALSLQDIPAREVSDLQATVADDEVGYVVASGGQSSMNLLLNGEIAALAIGERAFDRFSPDVQQQVVIIEETISAPSQLVSFRPGFDPDLEAEISRLLISLEETAEGKEILKSLRDTARFDEFPDDLRDELDALWELVQNVTQE